MGKSADLTRLVFECGGCKRDVSGSKRAVIHINHGEINRAEREEREWNERHPPDSPTGITAAELADVPAPALWWVHCDDCNPHRADDGTMCNGCYWFELSRCQTTVDLLHWTAHLMEKEWLKATDWNKLLRDSIKPFHVNP
ncbi:hypothetical protein [Plantactinospora endophytica]|uniref:Uncharacterized protein n=1 Tax=Plantactinospora endophytica TaxID=673535 RepID=A0ABQ4EFB7_9ACTN|nr:hypothetical protein [Plantactinospora endophytica]GIG93350.1 hypothetical protein Pen02_82860 [Plantactinospora endophytica]